MDGVREKDDVGVGLAGSIQSEVPVKPVWPKLPMGKTSPRGREKAVLMSQPKPRVATPVGGLAIRGEDGCSASGGCGLLGLRHQLQRGLLSGKGPVLCSELVEQGLREERNIACRGEDAGVSCYSAHAAGGGVVDGAAEDLVEARIRRRIPSSSWAVGAMSGIRAAGGRKRVCVIFSGAKMCSCA